MSNKLLGSLVAVISLLGCEEAAKPVEVRAPLQRVVAVTPKPVARDAGAVSVSIAPTEAKPDAGTDALSLAHDAPKVDHLARAEQLSLEGEVKGALVEARRALYSAPDDEAALDLIATLALRSGQPTLAAEAYGRTAQIRTDDATPLVKQARALYRAKDYAGAVMSGREALSRDSEHVEAQHIVGLAQLSMGELKGAMASLERTVELAPNHGWALNNLGLTYLRANENEKAADVLERSVALLPNVAFVHNNLGVALERVGRGDDAKVAYQHAMDLAPKYVKAKLNSARVAKVKLDDLQTDDATDTHPIDEE